MVIADVDVTVAAHCSILVLDVIVAVEGADIVNEVPKGSLDVDDVLGVNDAAFVVRVPVINIPLSVVVVIGVANARGTR